MLIDQCMEIKYRSISTVTHLVWRGVEVVVVVVVVEILIKVT